MSFETVGRAAQPAMHSARALSDVAPPAPQISSSPCTTFTLSESSTTLTMLQDTAQLSPVPFKRPTAVLALAILENMQVFRKLLSHPLTTLLTISWDEYKGAEVNNEAFNRLAIDTCLTVQTVVSSPRLTSHEGRTFPQDLIQHLKDLMECVYSCVSLGLLFISWPGYCVR
jgi:hypothetical protein